METIKSSVSTIKSNFIGAAVGAGVGYYASKKFGKVENKWALIGLTIVGAVAGAMAQAKFAAKKSAPTAATVKK